MPHLLVVLPGIGGSSLHVAETGRTVWGMDGVRKPIRRNELAPSETGLWEPDYADGIEARDLIAVPIPGLTRVSGSYQGLRDTLRRTFELDSANYLEFPYDWRRPNVVTAALLAQRIDGKLRELRRRSPRAKVIIVAHSMGGLVALQYLREHDPDRNCVRLITLGTPFRGAVKAVDSLANGYPLGPFHALGEVLRRLPSVYELLPLYPSVVDRRGEVTLPAQYVADFAEALGLSRERVDAAWDFLNRLNQPLADPARLQILAGFGSPTSQTGLLYPGGLTVSSLADMLPHRFSRYGPPDGDGTVPIWSAEPGVPDTVVHYLNESHLGMVGSKPVLRALTRSIMRTLTMADDDPYRGPEEAASQPGAPNLAGHGPRLGTSPEPGYALGEPVVVSGTSVQWEGRLWGRLDSTNEPRPAVFGADGTFTINFGELEEGLHTLTLTERPRGPERFVDVIEVA